MSLHRKSLVKVEFMKKFDDEMYFASKVITWTYQHLPEHSDIIIASDFVEHFGPLDFDENVDEDKQAEFMKSGFPYTAKTFVFNEEYDLILMFGYWDKNPL